MKGDDFVTIFKRGVLYGFSLVVLNGLLSQIVFKEAFEMAAGFVVFLLAGIYFLKREEKSEIFACGFAGLFSMFFFQIVLAWAIFPNLNIYVGGFFGTMVALAAALLTRGHQFKLRRFNIMEECEVFTKGLRLKMLIYALVSAISFIALVLYERAGVSVAVFALLQLIMLYFIVPEKRRLLSGISLYKLTAFVS